MLKMVRGCASMLVLGAALLFFITLLFVVIDTAFGQAAHPTPTRTPNVVAPTATPDPGSCSNTILPERLETPDLTCRARNRKGEVVRSAYRRSLFWRMTGFPKGRDGCYADHVVPLACGGCDVPSNMQWLTEAEWKDKTRWERRPCSAWWDGTNVVRTR